MTLHTNGELILWPYGYTKTDVPADMTADDHATFVAMGRAMAALNGYTAKQSSDLYVTDGDQIDWMYGRQHIFSFTFELYPTEQVSSHADHEPPDEVIAAQTARNRGALLYLHRHGGLSVRGHRQGRHVLLKGRAAAPAKGSVSRVGTLAGGVEAHQPGAVACLPLGQ